MSLFIDRETIRAGEQESWPLTHGYTVQVPPAPLHCYVKLTANTKKKVNAQAWDSLGSHLTAAQKLKSNVKKCHFNSTIFFFFFFLQTIVHTVRAVQIPSWKILTNSKHHSKTWRALSGTLLFRTLIQSYSIQYNTTWFCMAPHSSRHPNGNPRILFLIIFEWFNFKHTTTFA